MACCEAFGQSWFTLIDDDAKSVEAISAIKTVADKHGIKMCFGVIAHDILHKPDVVNTLLGFQDKGHQVCNHSFSHDTQIWKSPNLESIENEFMRSEKVLDSLGFTNHNYLIYPWGCFKSTTRAWLLPLASRYFNLAFDARGGVCDLQHYNRYYIHRMPLRKHENISIVKREIDKVAKTDGAWIVFLTHSAMQRDFSDGYVSDIIGYCKDKGLRNVTVDEAYNHLRAHKKLKECKTEDRTIMDEIEDFLYKHMLHIMNVFIVTIFLIIVFYQLRLQK